MKKIPVLILFVAMSLTACKSNQVANGQPKEYADTVHNSRNSLDWAGYYRGMLPCADCEGIQTEIKLNKDLTYEKARRYAGKSREVFRSEGTFSWDKKGRSIILDDDQTQKYKVGENLLFKLDRKGNRIEGALAENYILRKDENKITGKYWKLVELNGEEVTMSENQRKEAHFILRADNQRVNGNGGCNNFMGSFELPEKNTIEFSRMASTMMACPGVYENEFLQMFERAKQYSVMGDFLQLQDAEGETLAKFEAVYF